MPTYSAILRNCGKLLDDKMMHKISLRTTSVEWLLLYFIDILLIDNWVVPRYVIIISIY